MASFLSIKIVRLLLVFCVSVWMAGGCLLGCGSTVMAASRYAGKAAHSEHATVAKSCHAASNTSKQPTGVPSFVPGPRGSMTDCPLVVNATAATSKNSGKLPDPGRGLAATLPLIEYRKIQPVTTSLIHIPPNRDPTYLRCCVLLI